MKSSIGRYLWCYILFLIGIVFANASTDSVFIHGDVNGDGVVDIADGVTLVNHIVGKPTVVFYSESADVDCDGVIDIADAVGIIKIAVGKETISSIDTIRIKYQENAVYIDGNFDEDRLHVIVTGTSVKVVSLIKRPFVCSVEGTNGNGSLVFDTDTTCTLILNGLHLTSQESAAISFSKKQKVNVELPEGTENILGDATFRKDNDGANACLYSKGTLSFSGKGSLSVFGKYGNGIASSKNISVDGSHIIIAEVIKNGIHCDKFTLKKGQVDLHLQNKASKGIKVKEELVIKGGTIEGEATGGITNSNGDLSYCSLLKSDGTMTVSGGTLTLKQSGDGGRCISVDKDLTMTGGVMNLECSGNGGQYQNTEKELDYYTPKCITVDDTVKIKSGRISCLSTGLGGKGIVAGKILSIGCKQNDENLEPPYIRVETKGECIINNEDEDLRFGCPKGLKSDSIFVIYDGDIAVTTAGMGGEGLESNEVMFIYGGTLECNTFDDGINVGKSIEIAGGNILCNSEDNDGIDSNGSIHISGGVIASINQTKPNESFDSEKGQFFLSGGTVFGLGSGPVDVRESTYPCYTTPYDSDEEIRSRGLILTEGKYICLQKNSKVIMALRNDNKAFRSFVTVTSPLLSDGEWLTICEGDPPTAYQQSWFGGRLLINGTAVNSNMIIDIQVNTIK